MRSQSCPRAAHLVLAAALSCLLAGPALTAPLGVNLGWDHCGTNGATANKAFACDNNTTSFTLVGSFRIGFDVPDFVGVSAALDVSTAAPSIPSWFALGSGGCREGELSMHNVGPVAGCTNPWAGAFQGGGHIVEAGPTPDRFRVRLMWARDLPGFVSGADLHTAFVFGITSAHTIDDGSGACAGCEVPACFVFNALELYAMSNPYTYVRILESPDVRNWATWQGGSGDCPGATPTRHTSWGQVKSLYR